MLAFESQDFEPKEDEVIDFSNFELTNEDADLLNLYFTKDLTEEDLHPFTEEKLLLLFDFALSNGMIRFEALLGKEISQRVLAASWEKGQLLRDRKKLGDDSLKPLLALIK